MIEQVKFKQVTRVIDPETQIHYLDAVDDNGEHWYAEMQTGIEKWIVYTRVWTRDPQQPRQCT